MINHYQTTLIEKKSFANEYYLLKFALNNPAQLEFEAGQYLILKVNDVSRLYSIYSPDYEKNNFELLIKLVPDGLASQFFSNIKIGDQVSFEGPAGVFNLKENNKDKIFLATATGLAPLWSMITSYFHKPQPPQSPKCYLFWGLRNLNEVFNLDRLKQLATSNQQFKFFICLSRETDLNQVSQDNKHYFRIGRINIALDDFIHQQCNNVAMKQCVNNFDYYLCGSRQVVDSLNQYLLDKGIAKENIYFEKF